MSFLLDPGVNALVTSMALTLFLLAGYFAQYVAEPMAEAIVARYPSLSDQLRAASRWMFISELAWFASYLPVIGIVAAICQGLAATGTIWYLWGTTGLLLAIARAGNETWYRLRYEDYRYDGDNWWFVRPRTTAQLQPRCSIVISSATSDLVGRRQATKC